MELPENVKSGGVARLFPVIAETGKEQRASSIFLSVLSAVPPFADILLSQLGQSIGSRTTIDTFTEIVFKNDTTPNNRDRPDGLIRINTGRRTWSCIVEAKIGKSTLQMDQVERYLRLARDNSIDAVLTISNEFAALATHHPLNVQKTLTKKVDLLHLSWSAILTEAVLLHEQAAIKDPEQAFLLREFVRFFSHESAGVTGFTIMPKEWSVVVDRIQAGGKVTPGDGAVIVDAWHQEIRDLTLIMSRIISCRLSTKLPRTHVLDPVKRRSDDLQVLCEKGFLLAELEVPNAASTIKINADLNTRSIRLSMEVNAPKDRAKNISRVNWLLRQLKDLALDDVYISAIWASRAAKTVLPISELRASPENIEKDIRGAEIRAFEVTLTSDSARRFAGIKTFIEQLELLAPLFYEKIGQHLSTWQAPPPKPKHTLNKEESSEELPQNDAQKVITSAGNSHTDLLEIPSFLHRIWN